MHLDSEMKKLKALIVTACKEHYNSEFSKVTPGSIESYALFCDSFAVSVGVAASTKKSTMIAALWENINHSFKCFSQANSLIMKLDELLYEDVFEDYPVEIVGVKHAEMMYYRKKMNAIYDALKELKDFGFFNQNAFSKEVFLSIQLPDPDETEKKETLEYCQKLNADEVNQRFSQELL